MPLARFLKPAAAGSSPPARLLADIRPAVALLSLLLSAWSVYRLDIINNDGVLYLLAAQRLLAGDWSGAYDLYRWLFYPGLIALVSYTFGLDPETAAQLLNALFSALLVVAFVTLVNELGADRKILPLAAGVILLHPYLNDSRPEIVRDHGYWAFYLSSLLCFIRFYRRPEWSYALGWGVTITLATLFRIEGVTFLLLLPSVLWLRRGTPLDQRLKYFLRAHGVTLVLAAGLGVWMALDPEFSRRAGRLYDPIARLSDFWLALNSGWQEKAQRLREAILDRYSQDNAGLALAAILLLILLTQIVKTLTPLYSVLLCCPALYRRWRPPPGTVLILVWAALLNLLIILVFLVHFSFLTGRYAVPLSLLALLVIPFLLVGVYDWWQARRDSPAPRRWLPILFLLGLIWTAGDSLLSLGHSSKAYIRDAGLWLRAQLPAQARLYTNHQRLYYYSGRLTDFWEQVGRMQASKWSLSPHWLQSGQWRKYDYLAIWMDPEAEVRQILPRWPELELIKTFEDPDQDAVYIYRVKVPPPTAENP